MALHPLFLHRSYTIGGEMIFPKHTNSINQTRGTNPQICDRFDLTLECIRRYYRGEDSPLFSVLSTDKNFFDLFIDFKGFVDFFMLQDLVSELHLENYHFYTVYKTLTEKEYWGTALDNK